MVDTKIKAVSLGNANVAIDCEDLGCLAKVSLKVGMDVIDLGCDWGAGVLGTLRGNPTGELTIDAKNLDAQRLKWVYDAVVTTKSTDESVDCLKITNIVWTPDDIGTPTAWTAEVNLHTSNVDNTVFYTDDACTVPWADTNPTPGYYATVDECTGIASLTTDDEDQALDTLYVSFDYGVDFDAGVSIVDPAFDTFPADHSVIIWHRNKTTGTYSVFVAWKAQVIVDGSIDFGDFDSNTPISVPIHLRLLSVPDVHPEAPLFKIYDNVVDLPAFIATLAI
jgi:hypothetical protein